MKNIELNKQVQRINNLIASTFDSANDKLELQGHWGKYLCVIVAGFLENAISQIYIDFTESSSSPAVASFARAQLLKINNPKSSKFVEIATAFKKEWGLDLQQYFVGNVRTKEAIDSVMTNRHLIAHGKTATVSISQIKNYFQDSLKVLDYIESQCGVS